MEERDFEDELYEFNQNTQEARGDRWTTAWSDEDVHLVRKIAHEQVAKGRKVSVKSIARQMDDECRGSLDGNNTPQGQARIRHILRGGTFKHVTHKEIGTRHKGGRKSQFSEEQKQAMVAEHAAGASFTKLGEKYGVSRVQISRIVKKNAQGV